MTVVNGYTAEVS